MKTGKKSTVKEPPIASKDTIKPYMYYILVHLNITDLALMDLEQAADFEVWCAGINKDSLISSDGRFSTNYEVMKSFPYSKEPNENTTTLAEEPRESVSKPLVSSNISNIRVCSTSSIGQYTGNIITPRY